MHWASLFNKPLFLNLPSAQSYGKIITNVYAETGRDVTLISSLSAAACVTYLYFGFYFFAQRPKSAKHRYFFLFNLSFALWSFSYAIVAGSGDPDTQMLWRKIGYVGALSYEVFMLEFFLRHTGLIRRVKRPVPLSLLLWAVPLIWIYMNLAHNAIHEDFPAGFWYIGLHLIADGYNLISIALIWLWIRSSDLRRERIQGMVIISGGLITIVLTLFSDFFFGLLGLPTITPILILFYIAVLFYAALRYRLLGISEDELNRRIVEGMGDFMVLLDRKGRIVWRGESDEIDPHLLNASTAAELFQNHKQLFHRLERLSASGGETCRMLLYPQNGHGVPREIQAECSLIRDRFHDVVGTLITGKSTDRLTELQRSFGLSEREVQITQLLLGGETLRRIGEELGIRENTVKTHTSNIYNKIGINSRAELMAVADSYTLVQNDPVG